MTTQVTVSNYDEQGNRRLMAYDLPEGHTAELRANSIGYEMVECWIETDNSHISLNTVLERSMVRTVFFDAQFKEIASITKANDWQTKVDNSGKKILLPGDFAGIKGPTGLAH
jgi:hypothetical protein